MRVILLGFAGSTHLIGWANAMSRLGHEILVASQHAPGPGYDPGVEVVRLPFSGHAGYFLNAPALGKLLREREPHLLHAHYAGGYGTLAHLTGFSPRIVSVWGSDIYLFPRKNLLSRLLLTRTLRDADAVLSTSRHMAAAAREIVDRTIEITPFGIDLEQFSPNGPHDELLTVNGPVIGSVRALERVYGMDVLIEAFSLIVRDPAFRAAKLILVGDGSERTNLTRLAARLGVEDRVVFKGKVPHGDVPRILRSLDVFVALSRSESFCVAALEAQATGLPVVASDVGGLPEVVENGVTGLLVPTESPSDAAEAIMRILGDPETRRSMGAAARPFVAGMYEKRACIGKMDSIYRRFAPGTSERL